MPEYTEHERAQLHAKARQQIRMVTLTTNEKDTEYRRLIAVGYLLALRETEAVTTAEYAQLNDELMAAICKHLDALYQQSLPPGNAGQFAESTETRARMRTLFIDHLEHTLKVLDLLPGTYERTMVVPLMVAAQTLVNELIASHLVTEHDADILVVRLQRRYVNAFLPMPEPESGVHCTGHVDYDPASRKPKDTP